MLGTRDIHQPWCKIFGSGTACECSCGMLARQTLRAREGQLNVDTDIVEAALDAHSLPEAAHREVWEALHLEGKTAHQIAALTEARFPGFAATLRRGTAERRSRRFGVHGA